MSPTIIAVINSTRSTRLATTIPTITPAVKFHVECEGGHASAAGRWWKGALRVGWMSESGGMEEKLERRRGLMEKDV